MYFVYEKDKGEVMKILFLIIFATFAFADLSRSSSGIVRDDQTHLEWADHESVTKTWEEAIDYCEELSLNGGGWRLANINELLSIMGGYPKSDLAYPHAINGTFVNVDLNDEYWSSTYSSIYYKDAAIRITARKGIFFSSDKISSRLKVRCVRDLK